MGEYKRAELRSPDPLTNPYLAFALLIYAGIYGIENNLSLPEPANVNLYTAGEEVLSKYKKLPCSREEAAKAARGSEFLSRYLHASLINNYCKRI